MQNLVFLFSFFFLFHCLTFWKGLLFVKKLGFVTSVKYRLGTICLKLWRLTIMLKQSCTSYCWQLQALLKHAIIMIPAQSYHEHCNFPLSLHWTDMKAVENWIKSVLIKGKFPDFVERPRYVPGYFNDGGCAFEFEGSSFYVVPFRYDTVLVWALRVSDFAVILGWEDFVRSHHLKVGYHLLVQHTRLNIFDIRIFDEEWKEVVFSWTVENSSYDFHRAVNGTRLPEQALAVGTVYGAGKQRTTQEFYNFSVYWAEYS